MKLGDYHKSELFALAFGHTPCAVLLPPSFMNRFRTSYNPTEQQFYKGVFLICIYTHLTPSSSLSSSPPHNVFLLSTYRRP